MERQTVVFNNQVIITTRYRGLCHCSSTFARLRRWLNIFITTCTSFRYVEVGKETTLIDSNRATTKCLALVKTSRKGAGVSM